MIMAAVPNSSYEHQARQDAQKLQEFTSQTADFEERLVRALKVLSYPTLTSHSKQHTYDGSLFSYRKRRSSNVKNVTC